MLYKKIASLVDNHLGSYDTYFKVSLKITEKAQQLFSFFRRQYLPNHLIRKHHPFDQNTCTSPKYEFLNCCGSWILRPISVAMQKTKRLKTLRIDFLRLSKRFDAKNPGEISGRKSVQFWRKSVTCCSF